VFALAVAVVALGLPPRLVALRGFGDGFVAFFTTCFLGAVFLPGSFGVGLLTGVGLFATSCLGFSVFLGSTFLGGVFWATFSFLGVFSTASFLEIVSFCL